MDYRESFNMSDSAYGSFLKEMREEVKKDILDNSAELLLQAELITMNPIEGIEPSAPVSSLEFKTRLVNNYYYLAEDFEVYTVGHILLDVLVDFLLLDFNKTHRE